MSEINIDAFHKGLRSIAENPSGWNQGQWSTCLAAHVALSNGYRRLSGYTDTVVPDDIRGDLSGSLHIAEAATEITGLARISTWNQYIFSHRRTLEEILDWVDERASEPFPREIFPEHLLDATKGMGLLEDADDEIMEWDEFCDCGCESSSAIRI